MYGIKKVFKINLNDSMLYFGLYVQLRRGSVAGYTTDESWAYGPKEGVEAFESITFFIRFIYAINFEHLFMDNYFTKTFLTLPSDILMMAMPFWVLPIFTPLMLKRAASVASFEDISMLAMPEAGS